MSRSLPQGRAYRQPQASIPPLPLMGAPVISPSRVLDSAAWPIYLLLYKRNLHITLTTTFPIWCHRACTSRDHIQVSTKFFNDMGAEPPRIPSTMTVMTPIPLCRLPLLAVMWPLIRNESRNIAYIPFSSLQVCTSAFFPGAGVTFWETMAVWLCGGAETL